MNTTATSDPAPLSCSEVEQVFTACFRGTELHGGASEPLYLPGSTAVPAKLFYREDFVASALHECAHWCIAGRERRAQIDFGYTYLETPRDARTQQAFFNYELKTQSLESVFAAAAGINFQVSADNLECDPRQFSVRVMQYQVTTLDWLTGVAGARAQTFRLALIDRRGQAAGLAPNTENQPWNA